MSSKNVKIFDETGCLSEDALEEYAHGQLGIHLKKQVEIHINECDFCRDALEGISLMKSKEASHAAVAVLNQKIANYGKPESVAAKVIPMINYSRLAAAVALFFVLGGGVLFLVLNPLKNKETAYTETTGEKVLAENKEQAVQPEQANEPDEVSSSPSSSVAMDTLKVGSADKTIEAPAPAKEQLNDQEKDADLKFRNESAPVVSGTTTTVVSENAAPANYNYSEMTATGGHSNAATYYSNQGMFSLSPGATKPLTDSVITFQADRYVNYDMNGAFDQQKQLSEVTVSSYRMQDKKASGKKSQKEADMLYKAEVEEQSKAESGRKAKEESAKLSEEKRLKEESEAKARVEAEQKARASAEGASAKQASYEKLASEKAAADKAASQKAASEVAVAERKKADETASVVKNKNNAPALANDDKSNALKVAEEREEVAQAREDLEGETMKSVDTKSLEAEAKKEEKVYAFVDDMPVYPGGVEALKKYISQQIQYPQAAKEKGVSGTVYISYVVNDKGKVTNVKVWKSVEAQLDKEAVRVVSTVKGYTPGIQDGKPVSVQMQVPVKFSLE